MAGDVPLSRWRGFQGVVYTSGQVGRHPETSVIPEDFADQVRQAVDNLRAALEDAGSSMDRVLKTTVYIRRVSDFEEMNTLYAELFPSPYPARTTIVADLARPTVDFEIEAVAYTE